MNKNVGFKDLEVYKLAKQLAVEIHKMTLSLPKFELFEEGSQVRRSSKSVVANIVEGFGRRRYKNEFLKHITIALSECDETQVHLELLYETGSLKDEEMYQKLKEETNKLARMLNTFFHSILKQHIS
ncbi:MAG: four helix bundle protein [Candidatus Zhuqueibacterota bacterium]